MYRYLHIALWLTAATPAAHAADPAAPPASDASARVPETRYDSAFTGYRPYLEQKLAPWRELNDDVHKAGGHIGIFGGAAGTRAAPEKPARPPEQRK